MPARDMVLVCLRLPVQAATLEQVKRRYAITDDEIDSTFGVIEVDHVDGIYTIRVTADAAGRVDARFRHSGEFEGTYGDVRIEPFGPA